MNDSVHKVTLHPVISELVNEKTAQFNKQPSTKWREFSKSKPTTADDVVNEILWLALRTGDISKHYTHLKPKNACHSAPEIKVTIMK